MFVAMTRVSGNAAPDVSRWERERMQSAERPARRIHTELGRHASPEAVEKLSRRPAESALGRRLDDYLKRCTATYVVAGQPVRVTVPFRSRYGEDDAQTSAAVQEFKKAVGADRFSEIALAARRAISSRGTPEDVRLAAQALIDAGVVDEKLREKPGMSRAEALHKTMEDHKLGFDCRGYVYQAFLHARGTGSLPANRKAYFDRDVGDGQFHEMNSLRKFESVAAARSGDILRLKPGKDGRDHNLIVRSNELREVSRGGKVTVVGRDVPESFVTAGWSKDEKPRVRVITVDSSWGGTGPRREVWLYNERTKTWGDWVGNTFRTSNAGPYGHEFGGVYRARSES